MFIRVTSHFYRMYGLNNQTGALLYDDLGFYLPRDFPEQQWAVESKVCDLQLYDADHVFVMVDPTEDARAQLRQLQQSSAWLALKAVQEGHVYNAGDIFSKRWVPPDACGPCDMWQSNLGLPYGDIVQEKRVE